ncbi:MAG: hypothetical protein AAFY63_01575 [Cyanobacteria bacterium J06643_13]
MKKRLGEFWVVYDSTKNYPDDYVRIMYHDSELVEDHIVISPSLNLIRELLKGKNLVCLPPDVDGVDNPAIVELWVNKGE